MSTPTFPEAAWFEMVYGIPGATGASSTCDISENSRGRFPVNNDCFNSGSCIVHLPGQPVDEYPYGKCECADPNIETNFANDPQWIYGKFEGTLCNEFQYQIFATISYIIYHSENEPSSPDFAGIANEFECGVGASGSGINFGEPGWETTPDMTAMVRLMINYPGHTDLADPPKNYEDYGGKVVPYRKDAVTQPQHCKICSNANPCTHPGRDSFGSPASGGYLMVTYASNFNTYYSTPEKDCEKADGSMPLTSAAYIINPDCDSAGPNFDKGYEAYTQWNKATLGDDTGEHHREHYLELTQQPTSTPVRYPTVSDPAANAFGMGWSSKISIPGMYIGYQAAGGVSTGELAIPTLSPTNFPTPEDDKSCFGAGYTHQIEDLEFVGIAEAGNRGCRWGLETFWPGGNDADMCDSPYVTCLPVENTPNVGFPLNDGTDDPYKSTTHVYTLEECKKECAYDQRCNGFEFNPTAGQTGNCVLIDDLPVVATSPSGSNAHPVSTEQALIDDHTDWTTLGGSVCYAKKATTCHPYFTADDLSDVMLKCYCPNNRKGFYTKKVHRTVAATVYCGADPTGAITERIKTAQANRMFHLCENWCLFNTQAPRTESWYHDPWNQCWREQYAGIGTHRSYCYRVIRDPYTIEQYFIDQRSANMCPSSSPAFGDRPNTPSPINANPPPEDTTWVLAQAEDSCEDACTAAGFAYCTEASSDLTSEVILGIWPTGNPFEALSIDCSGGYITGDKGWAHPSVGPNGECILRNELTNDQEWTEPTGCNVAIGVGYRRLCSCSSWVDPASVIVTG